jgi:hypothetical protein
LLSDLLLTCTALFVTKCKRNEVQGRSIAGARAPEVRPFPTWRRGKPFLKKEYLFYFIPFFWERLQGEGVCECLLVLGTSPVNVTVWVAWALPISVRQAGFENAWLRGGSPALPPFPCRTVLSSLWARLFACSMPASGR